MRTHQIALAASTTLVKGASMDVALAELQLTKHEAQHAANLADWHRVR